MEYDEESFLSQCHPVFEFRLRNILASLRALGWKPRIVYVKRTEAEQAEKVRKGYSKTMRSWHVAATIGILPEAGDAFSVVRGNAADIVDSRYWWTGVAANTNFSFWKDLGRIAKQNGCSWGGDWKKFKDVAHVEFKLIEEPPQNLATV